MKEELDIFVRAAEHSDLQRVLEMICALTEFHGDTATVSEELLIRDVFSQAPWVSAVVAELKGVVVGYAILCRLVQLQHGFRGMEIHHLYVEPETRGMGVGTKLVRASEALALQLECRYLTISASAENLPAQKAYAKLGFAQSAYPGPSFWKFLDEH